MTFAARFTIALFIASSAAAGCGGSSRHTRDDDGGTSSDDGGSPPTDGTVATPGPACASDADCTSELPKCGQSGHCLAEPKCEVDADCRGDYPYCDQLQNCEPCLTDDQCPSETPYCTPSWEFGTYCAPCVVGDSSACPEGTWCASPFPGSGTHGGGQCMTPDCGSTASTGVTSACLGCANENAPRCTGAGGDCEQALATLRSCYETALPGWTSDDCPLEVPSYRGCTPTSCEAATKAFDACIYSCDVVTALCYAPGTYVAPTCVADADCPSELPKCGQRGTCLYETKCEVDADCRGQYPYCDGVGNCEPCLTSDQCPSEAPYCTQSFEGGTWCAECMPSRPEDCPAGTWCSTSLLGGAAGSCGPGNCGGSVTNKNASTSCTACANANSASCTAAQGSCATAFATLRDCVKTANPDGATDCPLTVPSSRACTTASCAAAAKAFDECIYSCDAVTSACSQ